MFKESIFRLSSVLMHLRCIQNDHQKEKYRIFFEILRESFYIFLDKGIKIVSCQCGKGEFSNLRDAFRDSYESSRIRKF